MIYDVLISCLATTGIAGALVYSYKIAHSLVYPVGIVKKMDQPSRQEPAAIGLFPASISALEREVRNSRLRNAASHEKARILSSGEHLVLNRHYELIYRARVAKVRRHTFQGREEKVWRCDHCGKVQFSAGLKCEYCEHAAVPPLAKEPTKTQRAGGDLIEPGQSLQSHSAAIQDLERRIRQLELESIKRQQARPEEEDLQIPQDWVH